MEKYSLNCLVKCILLAVFITFAVIMWTFVIFEFGTRAKFEREAVKVGVAYYKCDKKTANSKFTWKTNSVETIGEK